MNGYAYRSRWLVPLAVVMLTLVAAYVYSIISPIVQVLFSATVIAAVLGGAFTYVSARISDRNAAIQSMWKRADEYMTKYYFPMAIATNGLSTSMASWLTEKTNERLNMAFFWYTRFRIHDSRMTNAGIYTLLTRFLAEECADELRVRIRGAPNYNSLELSELSSLVHPEITVYDFSSQIDTDIRLKALFQKFQDWARKNVGSAGILAKEAGFFFDVMIQEINLLYQPWYKQKYIPDEEHSLSEIATYLGKW